MKCYLLAARVTASEVDQIVLIGLLSEKGVFVCYLKKGCLFVI